MNTKLQARFERIIKSHVADGNRLHPYGRRRDQSGLASAASVWEWPLGRRSWPGFILAVLLTGSTLVPGARAQFPAADDFNPGANKELWSPAVQTDGKILVGGFFTELCGQPRSYLGRLHPDGTLDEGFNPGASGPVRRLAVQTDGKILVGGGFTNLGGQPRQCIGRLNSDGTLDEGFNPGVNAGVFSLAVQADGKIVVGGAFTTLGGQPRSGIGRLNADGTLDEGFDPGIMGGVYSLAVQADGKILVGGPFTSLGGQPRAYIGRLNADGSLDEGFNPGADDDVVAVAVQADGKVLVGGFFTTLGGQPRESIGRLNADGTLDTGFNPGATYHGDVNSLAVQADGKILVGGIFTTLGDQPRRSIGRLNADGTLDTDFDPGVVPSLNSLAVQADGKILVGGIFTTLGGQPRQCIGRLNATGPATQSLSSDGSTITWLRGGTSPEVWRTTFDHSPDGVAWTELGAGTRVPGGWQLSGLSLSPGGTIRARGHVTGTDQGSGWFVETTTGPAALITQPSSRIDNVGATAWFTVLAAGTAPLSYQWFKDGVTLADGLNITGALTPTLTLSGVLKSDAGGYHVVVTNAEGSVTSPVATLTVLNPFIMVQPVNQSVNVDESVTFSVTAAGTEPLAYQWFKDGVTLADGPNIAGALTPTLTLSSVVKSDAGGYHFVATNPLGSVTSVVATLTVTEWQELLHITSSPWRYWDQGDQGTAWRSPGFNDSAWPTGVGLFGVEADPGQYPYPFNTFIPSTGSSPAGPTTVYYRTHFQWPHGTRGALLTATNFIDDGAVFYLNGVEVGRFKISADPVLFDTQPDGTATPEGQARVFMFPSDSLVTGDNVMAVEVHQYRTSSDDVFGMTLLGSPQDTFDIRLNLVRDGSDIILNWTGGQDPYQVQQTTTLGATAAWENVGEPMETTSLRIPIGPGNVFLRVYGQP